MGLVTWSSPWSSNSLILGLPPLSCNFLWMGLCTFWALNLKYPPYVRFFWEAGMKARLKCAPPIYKHWVYGSFTGVLRIAQTSNFFHRAGVWSRGINQKHGTSTIYAVCTAKYHAIMHGWPPSRNRWPSTNAVYAHVSCHTCMVYICCWMAIYLLLVIIQGCTVFCGTRRTTLQRILVEHTVDGYAPYDYDLFFVLSPLFLIIGQLVATNWPRLGSQKITLPCLSFLAYQGDDMNEHLYLKPNLTYDSCPSSCIPGRPRPRW